jgi:hypothetical protein
MRCPVTIDAKLPVRLAMRQEGQWWVAYLAYQGTMADSKELGRILLNIARDPQHKQAFLDLMCAVMADRIEDVLGVRPDMEIKDAPEHEISGNA